MSCRQSSSWPWSALATVASLSVAGCLGTASHGFSSDDNNPELVSAALAIHQKPATDQPMNATGKPLAFLATRTTKRDKTPQKLIAYDLQEQKELWRIETPVKSRVLVSRSFLAHRDESGKMIARAIATGAELWSVEVGQFLGATVDAERLYYVYKDLSGEKPRWWLVAIAGETGAELWRLSSPGTLGAPAAQGGLVFSPFLKQWLTIVDATTGKQLARIRGDDEEISFVRVTDKHVYFGSRSGVFVLDEKAASGKRAGSSYGRADLPDQFVRTHYHWDSFDLIQNQYSAYDRNRLLWRAQPLADAAEENGQPAGDQPGRDKAANYPWTLTFADDLVVVYTFRFFFGFDTRTGLMRWAYNHPRNDAIGASHLGDAIVFVSNKGEIGALDPKTGRRTYDAKVDAQLAGVTFDAGGFKPSQTQTTPTSTVTALASIAKDRDKRFSQVQRFAVSALASLPGADVTRDLIALIQNQQTEKKLYDRAVEVLITRKDLDGLGHLISSLQVPYDYITSSQPKQVGVIARAIAALGEDEKMQPAMRGAAVDALLLHLFAPGVAEADLVEVIRALGAIGKGAEIAHLRRFLVAYRADPMFAKKMAPLGAAVDVLLQNGGPSERELIGYLADEPRTQKALAEYARRALKQGVQSASKSAKKSP